MTPLALAILIVAIALVFDYINGFHDAANSIATIVATRVLTPFQAVLWAAFFNFIAAFLFGTAVAKTAGKGFVDLNLVTPYVILADLLGAGVGSIQRIKAVRWGIAANIVWAWVITIPAAAAI